MKHFLPGIPAKYRDILYFSFVSNNHRNNSFVIQFFRNTYPDLSISN